MPDSVRPSQSDTMAGEQYSPEEANAEVLRRIDEWAANADVEEWLDLDGLGLTEVPPQVCKLTSLKRLDLGGNQLTALPPEMFRLTGLTGLVLYSNQLATLPAEIGKLTSLTVLNLHSNRLTVLPSECGRLASLKFLNVGSNLLTFLPAEIGQLSALKRADFSENRLTTIPPEICELENLQTLYLHGNSSLRIPLEVLGATSEEDPRGKISASSRSILIYYFGAHPQVRLSKKGLEILTKTEESHAASPGESAETGELEDSPEAEMVSKPFELCHEVVLSQRLAGVGVWLILFGATLTAIGILLLFAPNDRAMISLVVFFPVGVPALFLGILASRSSMDRETVSIQGSPPQVWVRRFRAPKSVKFDDPRARVFLDRRCSASEIEWVSVDVGRIPDEGRGSTDCTNYYWHPVIKARDLPPKRLGTFYACSSVNDESFKKAIEKAGTLGCEVARSLDVPFLWDECPAFKADPHWKYYLYKTFTDKKWDWPWSVPQKPPSKPFWKV